MRGSVSWGKHLYDVTLVGHNNRTAGWALNVSQMVANVKWRSQRDQVDPKLVVLLNHHAILKDTWKYVGSDGYIVWNRLKAFYMLREHKCAFTDGTLRKGSLLSAGWHRIFTSQLSGWQNNVIHKFNPLIKICLMILKWLENIVEYI